MLKKRPVLTLLAILIVAALAMAGCGDSGDPAVSPPAVADPAVPPPSVPDPTGPEPSASPVTWFVPDGSTLSAAQITTLFDTNQLYFNVRSAANTDGEIRGQISPSTTGFLTDAGDPFAPNPANDPLTFAAILGGDQVKPRSVITGASGYGSVTLDPVTRQLTGFIVTSGIVGNAGQIRDGLPGNSGAIVISLEGGPVVWTVPVNTVLTDSQMTRLTAGAYYLNVQSDAFPDGEIRGQLNQRLRVASLQGSSEVPPVTTSASGIGFLALNPATRVFAGFVKVSGLSSTALTAVIHVGAAGTNGPAIVVLKDNGGGIWSVPANTVLSDAQVASFNNNELYFNIHTQTNLGGELRGQLTGSSVRVGTADLGGANEIPPVSTPASGTGIMAWNSVTGQVSGSVTTDRVNGTAAHIHSGSATTTGPVLITLTTTSPVTVAPTPAISFGLDIQPIFNASCAVSGCHVTGGFAPMSLEAGVSYANVINLVVPGDAAASYLFSRITGAILPLMPPTGTSLSATSLDLIRSWIDNGALNN